MRLIINHEACIGCSLCAEIEPDFFRMKHDSAEPVEISPSEADLDRLAILVRDCPAEAISLSEDSSPGLSEHENERRQ